MFQTFLIKSFSKGMIAKNLFHYLALLNILDAFVTFFGLELSIISELNPLMNKVYEMDPILFVAIKVVFSLFLYLFIFIKKNPTIPFLRGLCVGISFLHICFRTSLHLDFFGHSINWFKKILDILQYHC